MSNHPPGVLSFPILLDRERTMVFDLDAFCVMEDILKKNPFLIVIPSPKELRATVYAALVHEDPTLTLEQVGKLLHVGNFKEVSSKVAEAMQSAMPQPGEVPAGKVEEVAVAPAS